MLLVDHCLFLWITVYSHGIFILKMCLLILNENPTSIFLLCLPFNFPLSFPSHPSSYIYICFKVNRVRTFAFGIKVYKPRISHFSSICKASVYSNTALNLLLKGLPLFGRNQSWWMNHEGQLGALQRQKLQTYSFLLFNSLK